MLLKFISFCVFIYFSEGLCPNGTLEWQSNCFAFNANESELATAEIVCINLGGHLVSIHDAFTNMVLSGEAQNYFHGSQQSSFWIGSDNVMNVGKWSWTDSTPFDYNDWGPNEPKTTTGSNCAALSMSDGYWSAEDCFKPKPYVCSIPNIVPSTTTLKPSTTTYTPSCPDGWHYYSYTGYCYGIYHNQAQAGAEQVCISYGAHLVSIHSKNEDDFVGDLPFWPGHVWLGLYSLGCRSFYWTDGTPYDYARWDSGEPSNCNERCVEIYVNENNIWNDDYCDTMYQNFVCKKRKS